MKDLDRKFISTVINHYKKYGRHDLEWRAKITPYRILVSEIMLQQTQVERVKQKFSLWMKDYPTLKDLSMSSFEGVLMLWKGLGYQRRAKSLYAIAKTVQKIPTTFEGLCELPGVGVYTASAVCAFAYDQLSHPVLETNIRTTLIEAFHQGEVKIHDGVLHDDLTRLSSYRIVRNNGARIWYYALMDYGAHLKKLKISHNKKSKHYNKQTEYKGSRRELRAKILFAVLHKEKLPDDSRTSEVIFDLIKEGYIKQKGNNFTIQESL